MKKDIKPLYRKERQTRYNNQKHSGGDFRHERNTKEMETFEGTHKSMKKGQYGYDYTPLYRFLQSKVGQNWNKVHSEAVSRLNGKEGEEHIFYLVYPDLTIIRPHNLGIQEIVHLGEESMYHTLTVDEDGNLQYINKDAKWEYDLCSCCTHTLDGKVIKSKPVTYDEIRIKKQ